MPFNMITTDLFILINECLCLQHTHYIIYLDIISDYALTFYSNLFKNIITVDFIKSLQMSKKWTKFFINFSFSLEKEKLTNIKN